MSFIKHFHHAMNSAGHHIAHGGNIIAKGGSDAVHKAQNGIAKGTVAASDFAVWGAAGPKMRQQLQHLQGELKSLIGEYVDLSHKIAAYQDPINNLGKWTTALLHHASDYMRGIAVSYDAILKDDQLSVPTIQHLADAGVIKPLINLPIPGRIGDVPASVIPGVEAPITLKTFESLINMVGNSAELSHQITQANHAISTLLGHVSEEGQTLSALRLTADYLVSVDNRMIGIFANTCGVSLNQIGGNTPPQVQHAASALSEMIPQIEGLKANAFRTIRFVQNVISANRLTALDPDQRSFVVKALMADAQIAAAFETPTALRHFVDAFLDGTMLTKGILTLPPIPPESRPFLSEVPGQKQPFSDPQSSQFDPPDMSMPGFPT